MLPVLARKTKLTRLVAYPIKMRVNFSVASTRMAISFNARTAGSFTHSLKLKYGFYWSAYLKSSVTLVKENQPEIELSFFLFSAFDQERKAPYSRSWKIRASHLPRQTFAEKRNDPKAWKLQATPKSFSYCYISKKKSNGHWSWF